MSIFITGNEIAQVFAERQIPAFGFRFASSREAPFAVSRVGPARSVFCRAISADAANATAVRTYVARDVIRPSNPA